MFKKIIITPSQTIFNSYFGIIVLFNCGSQCNNQNKSFQKVEKDIVYTFDIVPMSSFCDVGYS